MKKATKILCGIAGVLALIEVSSTLGEVQCLYALWQIYPKATEIELNIFTNKDLHKSLNIDPFTSAKCRLIGRLAKLFINNK